MTETKVGTETKVEAAVSDRKVEGICMEKEAHYFCLNLTVSSFALFCTTQDLLTSQDILPKN